MRSRITTVLVALVAVALVGAALASAQGDVYHACVNDSSGAIFMVSGPDDCKNNETYIDWNRIGPQGPPGLANLYLVSSTSVILPNYTASATAWCDSGDQLVSGGYTASPWGGVNFHVLVDRPSFS